MTSVTRPGSSSRTRIGIAPAVARAPAPGPDAARVVSNPDSTATARATDVLDRLRAQVAIAALLDGVDGYIARHYNQKSELGAILDPLGDKLLLVEAMKTFNDIIAPKSGTVTALFIEDKQPVEYGQPLMIIE